VIFWSEHIPSGNPDNHKNKSYRIHTYICVTAIKVDNGPKKFDWMKSKSFAVLFRSEVFITLRTLCRGCEQSLNSKTVIFV
jgi:hypothetical protein